MAAGAPITQDVLTIPRKVPEGPQNLVGMTRPQLKEALIAIGTPEKQAKMRVNQIWQWVYHWGVRSFDEMTNLAKAYRAQLVPRQADDIGRAFGQLARNGQDILRDGGAGGHGQSSERGCGHI